jgi:hypothetical protein
MSPSNHNEVSEHDRGLVLAREKGHASSCCAGRCIEDVLLFCFGIEQIVHAVLIVAP